MELIFFIFGSVVLTSAPSLLGVTLFLREGIVRRWLLPLISFSTGALLGDVFLHILPEMAEDDAFFARGASLVLLGILLSFFVEKVIRWRHCHAHHCAHHVRPVGVLSLVGDAVHNFVDGAFIAGSFLLSIPLGVSTTAAVALHEIPQEVGDYAILLHSGFSRRRAIQLNVLSAATSVVGALLVLLAVGGSPLLPQILLPITAGNFLYIAGSDLIPELHEGTEARQVFLQILCMLGGIGVMALLLLAG